MKLFSFFALQPAFCHICYLHILRFQLIEKLDQSSKLRNSNMQLYRNGAPNPIANSKYGPKRVLKQKSWIWHRKIKKCIYTYIGNIQRQQQHTSLRLQLMHAIVLILVSPNSARWCVATPAKKIWSVAGCNNLACMGSPIGHHIPYIYLYICVHVYTEKDISLSISLSVYIYTYIYVYVYIYLYAGWAYRVTPHSIPGYPASTACHWQVVRPMVWFHLAGTLNLFQRFH